MRTTIFRIALFAGATLASGAARGENLLSNGSFEAGLAGWSRAGNVHWSAAGGGSARVDEATSAGSEVLFQCVPVAARGLYALSAAATLPVRSDASGALSVRVRWHADDRCGEAVLGGAPSLEFGPSTQIRQERQRVVVSPDGTRSATISLVARADAADTYAFAVDEVSFEEAVSGEVLTIPSAASAPAPGGHRWATDLWVRNRAPRDRWFAMRMRCPLPCGQNPEPILLRLGPNETRFLPDMVRDTLGGGSRPRAGAVEIAYDPRDGGLDAVARVAADGGDRTGKGTAIPVLPSSARTAHATFVGLSGPGGELGARVNAGAYNPGDAPVAVAFVVRDAGGIELGRYERSFAPHEWFQVSDLPAAAGAAPGAATAVVVEAERPLFPFVIAIDNRSGDPTWLASLPSFE